MVNIEVNFRLYQGIRDSAERQWLGKKKPCAVLPRDGAENMETLDLDC